MPNFWHIAVIPTGVALVVAGILFALTAGRSEESRLHRLGGLVPGLAYLAGHLVHFPQPAWRQYEVVDAWQWILPGAILAIIAVAIDAFMKQEIVRWCLRIGMLAVISFISLHSFVTDNWSHGQSIAWLSGISLGGALWWGLVEKLAKDLKNNWFAAEWLLLTVAAGGIIVLSGSLLLLDMMVMIGAGAGTAMLLQIFGRRQLAIGMFAITPFLMLMVWLNAYFYSEATWWRIIIPAVAPFAALVGSLPGISRARPWVVGLVRIAAVAMVLAVPVIIAAATYNPDPYAG